MANDNLRNKEKNPKRPKSLPCRKSLDHKELMVSARMTKEEQSQKGTCDGKEGTHSQEKWNLECSEDVTECEICELIAKKKLTNQQPALIKKNHKSKLIVSEN